MRKYSLLYKPEKATAPGPQRSVKRTNNPIALKARLSRIDGHQQEVVTVETSIYTFREVAQRPAEKHHPDQHQH